MENAVEALKIAGAVLMFILALSLSISCLSSANSSALNIASMYSREREYRYVKPASDFTRTVGIESIIPEMFYDTGKPKCSEGCNPDCDCGKYVEIWNNVFMEYFKDKNGNPLPLYYKTNQYGKRVDSEGNTVDNSSTRAVTINYINLEKEQIGNDKGKSAKQVATDHLSMILAGKNNWKRQYSGDTQMLEMLSDTKYGNQLMESVYPNGLYDYLKDKTFVEVIQQK